MGHKPQADIEIFSNDDDLDAPIHASGTTKRVATLFLDLHKITKSAKSSAKKKKMGWHRYYCLTGVIEASYGSAMITYTVKLGGLYILRSSSKYLFERQTGSNISAGVTHDVIRVRYE
jgi:hypothetical protein